MNIYVVGTRTEGSGGFEWRYDREDAEEYANESLRLAYLCHKMNERFEVSGIRKVELPPELAARAEQLSEDITDWLDEDPDLWEPGDDVPTVTIRPPRDVDRAEIKTALEGDSNDAEHEALVAVAEALGIAYIPEED